MSKNNRRKNIEVNSIDIKKEELVEEVENIPQIAQEVSVIVEKEILQPVKKENEWIPYEDEMEVFRYERKGVLIGFNPAKKLVLIKEV
jgi:hypothetical protein